MTEEHRFAPFVEKLRRAGLRLTRQRLALSAILFDGADKHVTAEELHQAMERAGVRLSLSTVYNTLRRFTQAGFLRRVVVDDTHAYFDTNLTAHHHFFLPAQGRLMDIPGDAITLGALPPAPEGTRVEHVDVIVRLEADFGTAK